MTIPIQMSLHGFIATAPQINFTANGGARFYARVGVEHYRKETDGSFTKLEPTFHDLVAYAKTAERAHARFKVGDNFVASGYINEYELDRNGQTQAREEFVARRIGHDLARTRYEIDRTPSRQPDPPGADLPAGKEPAQVVSL
ncbi:single-stranded DNA-binding protein [Nocardioides sp. URHA0032]|uniref:single-stranded DNA-binding protein n=1 Tax=Nocardioides sp. URHA0032 TaxID=1380388 RepID=UPI0004911EC7|nr:single-stranded DNA-binding protein [Nocardioides sp. URHA0032]